MEINGRVMTSKLQVGGLKKTTLLKSKKLKTASLTSRIFFLDLLVQVLKINSLLSKKQKNAGV